MANFNCTAGSGEVHRPGTRRGTILPLEKDLFGAQAYVKGGIGHYVAQVCCASHHLPSSSTLHALPTAETIHHSTSFTRASLGVDTAATRGISTSHQETP